MLVQRGDRTLEVREAPAGLAAASAGIRAGDQILLIDGRDVRPMSSMEIHAALGGEVGSEVKLTLVRAEQVARVTLRRLPPPKRRAQASPGDAPR
jgi:C-terminal processing protease CtpA/Prc